MRLPLLLMISCALPLSACSSPPPKNTEEPPKAVVDPLPTGMGNGTKCNPEKLKELEGKEATEALVKETVEKAGAKHARVVKPGMAVTMDYREDRLTIQVDENNKITSIGCN